jgi:hypothetical protein
VGTLYLGRDAYPTSGETFTGLPATILDGDAAPEDTVTFTSAIRESNLSDLRHALEGPQGFHGHLAYSIAGDAYAFKFMFAHLAAPLEPRDYATNTVHAVWAVTRSNITDMVRPMGRPAFNHVSARRNEELFLVDAADKLRRERLRLLNVQDELDRHFEALMTAEAALAAQEATFLALAPTGAS